MSYLKLTRATAFALVGFAAGLVGATPAATEEVVAYENEAAALAVLEAREAQFHSQMKDIAASLNQDLKATLDAQLKRLAAPQMKIDLALGEVATRG